MNKDGRVIPRTLPDLGPRETLNNIEEPELFQRSTFTQRASTPTVSQQQNEPAQRSSQSRKVKYAISLPMPEKEGCGVSKVRKSRIVGGVTVKPGTYPWMSLLVRKFTTFISIMVIGSKNLIFFFCLVSNLILYKRGNAIID